MHLHGHAFQVTAIGGQPVSGALRDTVPVPETGSVTVAFEAGEVVRWMMHCRRTGHLASGMMAELELRLIAWRPGGARRMAWPGAASRGRRHAFPDICGAAVRGWRLHEGAVRFRAAARPDPAG
ncbi:multicopper oxidase domain-containing protein [Mangrovicoccus ximenensis]|uniref:multicopper oxidase domain-containing protein n=1 Tax=Mangrovicoccus ximenensis TaxID=1911570 RepID=UPI002ED459FB